MSAGVADGPRLTIGLLGAEVPDYARGYPPHCLVYFQVAEIERRILAIEERLDGLSGLALLDA